MSEAQPNGTDPGLWAALREAREGRGLTISEVASALKLTPKQVEAMEAGELSRLPGAAFARGFLRNYARLLQLDPAPYLAVVNPARRESALPPQPPQLGRMPGGRGAMSAIARYPAMPALLATLGLLALVIAGWYYGWFEPRDEVFLDETLTQSEAVPATLAKAPPAVAVPPQVTQSAPAASAPASEPAAMPAASTPQAASAPAAAQSVPFAQSVAVATPAPQSPAVAAPQSAPVARGTVEASAPVSSGQRLVFNFDEESWIEVRDANDRVVHAGVNAAGSARELQGAAPFTVIVGNAPAVRLSYRGKTVDLAPHTKVRVARLTLP